MMLGGKTALITGGCSGIGRFIALSMARAGASVMIADVKECPETLTLLEAHGGEVSYAQTDVTRASEVRTLIDRTLDRYGRLDVAVNNAGTYDYSALTHEWSEGEWDRMLDLNLKGVWLCMKYELRPMLEQHAGAIVNISSVAGLVGIDRLSAYVASKHGVVGLTKTAALEYAEHGIRINAVCPGSVNEPVVEEKRVFTKHEQDDGRHPMGRWCTGEEIAEAVLWLSTDRSSFVTGQALAVDGGWSAR